MLRSLRLVFHTVKGHFRDIERKAGVSGAQVWVLSVVGDRPGIRLGELAKALDIHQSTASNLVKPLVEQELLQIVRRDDDRRIVELHVTAAARSVLRKAPPPLTGVLPDALLRLPPATLERLEGDLDELLSVLGADRRSARIPLGHADAD
ncbi:MAG TPA: MarR family transcriptional regulator [Ramlibacter sp.]